MSGVLLNNGTVANPPSNGPEQLRNSLYVATAAEAMKNYATNKARTWYKDGVEAEDLDGKYAFQRPCQTWFTPHVEPKFKLRRADKFYAIGSCFARGLEQSLAARNIAVESALPELVKLQPANTEVSGIGFTNKYNTYSIMNELRWPLDPDAAFPRRLLFELTRDDVDASLHSIPDTENLQAWRKLWERRELIQRVTKRIQSCRAVIVTLGLAEVWRDTAANIFVNCTPISCSETQPDRYEFRLTDFAENRFNLEEIYELLRRYGHPDFHIVVTVSPVPLMNTFSRMNIAVANTWVSLFKGSQPGVSCCSFNVDYFPSYEIVQNSDHREIWEDDLRHEKGAGGGTPWTFS